MSSLLIPDRRSAGSLLAAAVVSVALGAGIGLAGSAAAAFFAAATALVAVVALVSAAGPRAFASLAIMGAAATLGMNGVRITSFMSLADGFLLAGALALFVDPRSWRRLEIGGVRLQVTGFLVIVIGGLIGSFFADSAIGSAIAMTKLAIGSALMLLLFVVWSPTMRELTAVAWIWIVSVCASILVAVVADPGLYGRRTGLTTHPNHLGLACVLALGPAVALAGSVTGVRRIAAVGASVVLVVGIVVSGSRSALVGCSVVLIIAFVLSGRRTFVRGLFGPRAVVAVFMVAGGATMALALAQAIALPTGNAVDRILGRLPDVAVADEARAVALEQTLQRASMHPITGSGFEDALAAHNIYVQIWAAAGVLGVVALIAIVAATLAPLRPRRLAELRATGSTAVPLLLGFGASFAGYAVSALSHNALWDRYIWLAPAAIPLLVHHARRAAATRTHTAGAAARRGTISRRPTDRGIASAPG